MCACAAIAVAALIVYGSLIPFDLRRSDTFNPSSGWSTFRSRHGREYRHGSFRERRRWPAARLRSDGSVALGSPSAPAASSIAVLVASGASRR